MGTCIVIALSPLPRILMNRDDIPVVEEPIRIFRNEKSNKFMGNQAAD